MESPRSIPKEELMMIHPPYSETVSRIKLMNGWKNLLMPPAASFLMGAGAGYIASAANYSVGIDTFFLASVPATFSSIMGRLTGKEYTELSQLEHALKLDEEKDPIKKHRLTELYEDIQRVSEDPEVRVAAIQFSFGYGAACAGFYSGFYLEKLVNFFS